MNLADGRRHRHHRCSCGRDEVPDVTLDRSILAESLRVCQSNVGDGLSHGTSRLCCWVFDTAHHITHHSDGLTCLAPCLFGFLYSLFLLCDSVVYFLKYGFFAYLCQRITQIFHGVVQSEHLFLGFLCHQSKTADPVTIWIKLLTLASHECNLRDVELIATATGATFATGTTEHLVYALVGLCDIAIVLRL